MKNILNITYVLYYIIYITYVLYYEYIIYYILHILYIYIYVYIYIYNEFKINNLGEYHDSFVRCDTIMLAGAFKNIRNKCTEICKLHPTHFLLVPGLA